MFVRANGRSFWPVMAASTFDISCAIHRVGIASDSSVSVRHESFRDKQNRARFVGALRKYFKKLLDFTWLEEDEVEIEPGYRVSLKAKASEKHFFIVKIRRVGIQQRECISLMARKLGILESDIAYAGTKDAKGKGQSRQKYLYRLVFAPHYRVVFVKIPAT